MRDLIAGFDVGGSKVSLVIADGDGRSVHRAEEPTDRTSSAVRSLDDRDTYLGVAAQMERMLTAASDVPGRRHISAIGIVSAGPLREGGIWNPPNILPDGLSDGDRSLPLFIPLLEPLRAAFRCPVALENDCNGAVLGEVSDGVGADVRDKSALHIAYVTISTGFGTGVWDGGHLVRGKDGNAGEIGHIMVHDGGLPCGCGRHGCVEAYCSGSGIVRHALARLDRAAPADRRASLLTPAALTPQAVFAAADAGDPIAARIVDDAIYAAGVGFSALANAYDPEVISVGGGIALARTEILPPIEEEMLRHINVRPPRIVPTPLGRAAGERGALAIARRLMQAGAPRPAI